MFRKSTSLGKEIAINKNNLDSKINQSKGGSDKLTATDVLDKCNVNKSANALKRRQQNKSNVPIALKIKCTNSGDKNFVESEEDEKEEVSENIIYALTKVYLFIQKY